jgi:hypothetical protein
MRLGLTIDQRIAARTIGDDGGYLYIENAELERFQAEVSDWEHREYFEMF